MLMKVKVFGALVTAIALFSVSRVADGGSWNLQGGSGHRWNASGMGTLVFADGAVCSQKVNDTNYWVIPVPLSATDTTYSGQQFTGIFGSTPCTRLVSFNSANQVQQGSTCSRANGSIGAVYVPADGTLFVQSEFDSSTLQFGFGCLFSVKLTY
jgi:hypothetical protein